MPIQSWKEAGAFAKRQIPDLFTKRKFNFITIHYLYMIGMTILFSVILFGIGDIAYIDALFFASGSCTQSGLNTVDINLITTGQQFALYMAAMLCNPIIIHSTVVFIRLYWFEKRFKDVVKQARTLRRSKSRGKTSTQGRDDVEDGPPQMSVRGKVIKILRNTGHFTDGDKMEEKPSADANGKSITSSDDSKRDSNDSWDEDNPPIILRQQSSPADIDDERLPRRLSSEQHITFLQNQRNPKDDTTLRIPSPREFDRGGKPEDINNHSDDALARQTTTGPVENQETKSTDRSIRGNGPQLGNHITIDAPRVVRSHDRTTTFPRMNQRQPTDSSRLDAPRLLSKTRTRTNSISSIRRSNTTRTIEPTPYLTYQPTIGRNSFFVNLTEEQREELGGIEYRALKTLALVLVIYFFAFHAFGVICLVPWIFKSGTYSPYVTGQGQGRVWWGFFTAASAFNDLGFTLTNNSMISFGPAVFPMLLITFLVVFGNTGFPCMLRFVIWVISKCVPQGSGVWEELQFLLDHPRRCFTLLFPRSATWWLFAVLVVLNGLDLMFFVVLDLHDSVVDNMSPFIKFIDGLFQASSTRTAGFSVVDLANLHPAIQVSYLIMMYISVFPIAISMRRTNVYEEKSLGIYAPETEDNPDGNEPSYVGAHLRKQLSFDLWYVFLGLFVIACVEGTRLQNTNQYSFTLFSVLFEIISAYGTVGLSLGYPGKNASFSTEFQVLSKLVIIAMQIRGRHRGLPYELDRAVLLPSEGLHAKEDKEGQRLLKRRRSSLSQVAVDGASDSGRFRPETGLTSAVSEGNNQLRDRPRANTTKTETSGGSMAENHVKHVRSGIGNAMFKLASAPDAIREEASRLRSQ